jgi:hypothetical protein
MNLKLTRQLTDRLHFLYRSQGDLRLERRTRSLPFQCHVSPPKKWTSESVESILTGGPNFGVQHNHRKQRSNERSTAYYQRAEGKVKKEIQNAKRKRKAAGGEQQSCCQEDQPRPSPDKLPEDMQLVLDEVVLTPDIVKSSPTLPYLTTVIRLIEGRPLRQSDLVVHLLETLRQHSMAYHTKTDYVLRFLHQHPP